MNNKVLQIAVLIVAGVLEVGGDALIRFGLRGRGWALTVGGFVVLGTYGIVVNLLPMDFSKLLAAYVGVFAVVSVLGGRIVFKDDVPRSTWIGLAVILVGSLIVHFGHSSPRLPPGR